MTDRQTEDQKCVHLYVLPKLVSSTTCWCPSFANVTLLLSILLWSVPLFCHTTRPHGVGQPFQEPELRLREARGIRGQIGSRLGDGIKQGKWSNIQLGRLSSRHRAAMDEDKAGGARGISIEEPTQLAWLAASPSPLNSQTDIEPW